MSGRLLQNSRSSFVDLPSQKDSKRNKLQKIALSI